MKDLNKMKKSDFEKLPHTAWDRNDEFEFDSLIILPLNKSHDSGFALMDIIGCIEGKPRFRLSGCSDVIHIDGIGGYGYRWYEKYRGVPETVKPAGWNIDCLRRSRLLRIFCDGKIKCGNALSSFEIYYLNIK